MRLENVKKGMAYTAVTFLIFMGLFAYVSALAVFENSGGAEGISSQKVFHYWQSVQKGVRNLMNISVAKNGTIFEVNDSLPAQGSIATLLSEYGNFISRYFLDNTTDIHFEDSSGNRIPLESISPEITLLPMNVTYGWDSWGKNEMQIMSPVSSLGYIYAINMTIDFGNETIANNSITWSPHKDCRPNHPCLLLYLYASDATKTVSSAETAFDLSRGSKSDLVYCLSGNCWFRARVGSWSGGDPQNVLKIELQNLNITANTKITMNTSDFYANFPAKLFVGNEFARKLDNIQAV